MGSAAGADAGEAAAVGEDASAGHVLWLRDGGAPSAGTLTQAYCELFDAAADPLTRCLRVGLLPCQSLHAGVSCCVLVHHAHVLHLEVNRLASKPAHNLELSDRAWAYETGTRRLALDLQGERGKKRLAFLLKQAEVFQHFAPAAADQGKKCATNVTTALRSCLFCAWLLMACSTYNSGLLHVSVHHFLM